jgi:2-dehydro-3-deoxygluconokinase
MATVACIGECMIELRELPDGSLARGWGGDTLNTAVYLARLGAKVDYLTALGDDAWSAEMLAGWEAEGVGTRLVQRLAGRLPGLYVIQTDAKGERRFSYWRGEAPARQLFELPATAALAAALPGYELIYLSGITLSLYGEAGRERLWAALASARAGGSRVAFDTNFRPRGWPDPGVARAAFRRALAGSDTVLASSEDLELLFGQELPPELQRDGLELVLKRPDLACRITTPDIDIVVAATPVARVVDTTAAGDSFAATYLTTRLAGGGPAAAAASGHRLAGAVVSHRGAIIPRDAMPADLCSR